MSIEDQVKQVKAVAGVAARARWEMEFPWPAITRLESGTDGDWKACYLEPDTGTEEWVNVQRVGSQLHAYAWGDEKPHVWTLEEEA